MSAHPAPLIFATLIGLAALPALAAPPPTPAAPKAMKLTPAEQAAAFRAAGFRRGGGKWRNCDDTVTMSYTPGAIEQVADLNADGLPEVVITEGTTYCYGNTGTAFWLLSKQKTGAWKLMAQETGMASFLKTRGLGGWPDISVGGPGFCFPVQRWNGKLYVTVRWEYEGKRCRRPS